MTMRFSLVLATMDRTDCLKRFLRSVVDQSYADLEVLVVDQNPDDRLKRVIAPFSSRLEIRHLRSKPGLSRARNVGLRHATGDLVAFPDDDCWYPHGVLGRVADYLSVHPEDAGITGRPADPVGQTAVGRFAALCGPIDRYNVWKRATSITLFLRRDAVNAVGGFDESLGVGSGTPFGSAEEIDFVIRILESGHRILYHPDLIVHHPRDIERHDAAARGRAVRYGRGMGRVLRKHGYPAGFVAYHWFRPLAGIGLSVASGRWRKALYHAAVLRGRMEGWAAVRNGD